MRRHTGAETIDRGARANSNAERPSTAVRNEAFTLPVDGPAILFQNAAVQQNLHQRYRNELRALPAYLRRRDGWPDTLGRNYKTGVTLKRKAGTEPNHSG